MEALRANTNFSLLTNEQRRSGRWTCEASPQLQLRKQVPGQGRQLDDSAHHHAEEIGKSACAVITLLARIWKAMASLAIVRWKVTKRR